MFEFIWKKILRRRGFSWLSFPASILWIVSLGYRVILHFARRGPNEKIEVNVPIISIGNISVGGTGKTPILSTIARFLINDGYKVGIVSSAYGRAESIPFVKAGYEVSEMPLSATGDEVMLLADALPEAIFSVNNSKTIAAQNAADSERALDIILVDDGFQHFPLHRDIDIVTFDAAVPPRQLKMFPFGVLRESMRELKRADIIMITRSKFAKDLYRLKNKLQKFAPSAEIYSARFQFNDLVGQDRRMPLKYLEDKSVLIFAGIGNFRAFEKQIRALTRDIVYSIEFSDHQVYTDEILNRIKEMAEKHEVEVILNTGKDWFKVRHFDFGRELYYLSQTVDIDPGEEKLGSHLLDKIGVTKEVG